MTKYGHVIALRLHLLALILLLSLRGLERAAFLKALGTVIGIIEARVLHAICFSHFLICCFLVEVRRIIFCLWENFVAQNFRFLLIFPLFEELKCFEIPKNLFDYFVLEYFRNFNYFKFNYLWINFVSLAGKGRHSKYEPIQFKIQDSSHSTQQVFVSLNSVQQKYCLSSHSLQQIESS